MNKREKIIVLIAVVIGIYGFVDYFFLSSGNSETAQILISRQKQDADNIAAQATADIALIRKIADRGDYKYLFQRMESSWDNDPFIIFDPVVKVDTDPETRPEDLPELIYSGFVKIGSKLMAVINGMEYKAGETLRDAELKIRRITQGRVILLTKANKEIILNLEED